MTNRPFIVSIDPSHSGFGICFYDTQDTTDPHKATFITGKEKPNTLGCPELVNELLTILSEDLNARIDSDEFIRPHYLVVIEETFIHNLAMIRTMGSIHRDIGYIVRAVEPYSAQVELISPSTWKGHLSRLGILPERSGNIKPDAYKAILDKRFGMDLKHDSWSAWGLHKYIYDNIETGGDV